MFENWNLSYEAVFAEFSGRVTWHHSCPGQHLFLAVTFAWVCEKFSTLFGCIAWVLIWCWLELSMHMPFWAWFSSWKAKAWARYISLTVFCSSSCSRDNMLVPVVHSSLGNESISFDTWASSSLCTLKMTHYHPFREELLPFKIFLAFRVFHWVVLWCKKDTMNKFKDLICIFSSCCDFKEYVSANDD